MEKLNIKDMLETIFIKLMENETISENCEGRIKYYEIPETMEADGKPLIIITPLSPHKPTNFGSNEELNIEFTYQIDVQSNDRKLSKLLQFNIKNSLKSLNFYQIDGGLDEYFEVTKRFVDARRYRGQSKIYDINY